MADQENGRWVTMRGRRVFIKDGESPQDALNRSIAQKNDNIKDKQIAQRQKEADSLNGKEHKEYEKYSVALKEAKDGINKTDDERMQEFMDTYGEGDDDTVYRIDYDGPVALKVVDWSLKNKRVYLQTPSGSIEHESVDDIYFGNELDNLAKDSGMTRAELNDVVVKKSKVSDKKLDKVHSAMISFTSSGNSESDYWDKVDRDVENRAIYKK